VHPKDAARASRALMSDSEQLRVIDSLFFVMVWRVAIAPFTL
jgi:hypothetical protein